MPGLFGALRIDPHRQFTREQLESLLHRMATPLCHYEGYVTETFIDAGAGLAVGRTGLPHHHPAAWQGQEGIARQHIRAFFAGKPHYDGPAADQSHDVSWPQCKRRVTAASGSFSAVLHSAAGNEAAIVVDRQASQPIFYAVCDGLLVFAPEVKPLLEFDTIDKTLDWAALAAFLASGYLLSEQTFFSAIRRLPGGMEISLANGTLGLQPYWRFCPGENERDESMADYADAVGRRIDAAVARDLDDPEKTVLLLSGGVDSRAILGAAYHAMRRDGSRINSVTWGCSPGRARADIQIARQLAKILSLNHQTIELDMAGYDRYGELFRRVNYLLDGMSVAAAIHPDKFAITERLYDSGCRVLLRGEQTFGFAEREYCTLGSLAKLGLSRFKDIEMLARIVNPDVHRVMAHASDQIMEALVNEASGLNPNDFTHRAYFRDRYQRLSGPAAYYKQVLMDHRSPLMDNALLDVIEHLPKACRDDKALLYYTVQKRYSELSGIRYAERTNLEDWAWLVAADTPVRRYALEELSDASSGIWRYLNRVSVQEILAQAALPNAAPRRDPPAGSALRSRAKTMLYKGWPRLAARMRLAKSTRQGVAPHKVLLRFLILKNWHDTFVRR